MVCTIYSEMLSFVESAHQTPDINDATQQLKKDNANIREAFLSVLKRVTAVETSQNKLQAELRDAASTGEAQVR